MSIILFIERDPIAGPLTWIRHERLRKVREAGKSCDRDAIGNLGKIDWTQMGEWATCGGTARVL